MRRPRFVSCSIAVLSRLRSTSFSKVFFLKWAILNVISKAKIMILDEFQGMWFWIKTFFSSFLVASADVTDLTHYETLGSKK